MNRELVLDYLNEYLDDCKRNWEVDLKKLDNPEYYECGTFDWDEIRKYHQDKLKEIEDVRKYARENLK